MTAYSKNTKIISMNGGFVSNAVCDTCTTVIPTEAGLKEKLEASLAETKLQQYRVTEENGQITIFAKGVPAHASMPELGVNAAGVTFECLAKAGFEDDFVKFYNEHIGTSCDGAGVGLKFADEYGAPDFMQRNCQNGRWYHFMHDRYPCAGDIESSRCPYNV